MADQKIGRKLVQRPWNQYEPDETAWWLVPSTEWPAYRCGKFYFDWGGDDRTTLLCGLYTEKGLDPKVSAAYPSVKGARFVMQSDWTWFRLLRDLKSHRVAEVIKGVALEMQLPVEIRIDGGYIPDPQSFDPFAPRFGSDVYLLQWQHPSNTFVLVEAKPEAHLLGQLANVATFNDLSHALETFNDNAWIWVDVFITIRFRTEQTGPPNSGSGQLWSADAIWERFLHHLLPWAV